MPPLSVANFLNLEHVINLESVFRQKRSGYILQKHIKNESDPQLVDFLKDMETQGFRWTEIDYASLFDSDTS